MNGMFIDETITEETPRHKLEERSGKLYGQLRFAHLKYHIAMLDILTPNQVKLYNELRGNVGGGNLHKNIPEKHNMDG